MSVGGGNTEIFGEFFCLRLTLVQQRPRDKFRKMSLCFVFFHLLHHVLLLTSSIWDDDVRSHFDSLSKIKESLLFLVVLLLLSFLGTGCKR